MPRGVHAWSHRTAVLAALTMLGACLSEPNGLPPFDGAPPGEDAGIIDAAAADTAVADAAGGDASPTDAQIADASASDATPADAQTPDALGDAGFDAPPSTNTHSVRFTPADDSYLAAADQPLGLDVVDALTFEAWIRVDELPPSGDRWAIAVKSNTATLDDSYSFALRHIPGTGILMIATVNGTASAAAERDSLGWDMDTMLPDTWYHVAVTYDLNQADVPSKFRFYLNGTEVTGGSLLLNGNIDTIRNSAAPLVLGARVTGGATSDHFNGWIDEVRIWNVVRSGTDIANNRNNELAGNEPGLIGYWQLDNSLLDEVANSNDLTVTGSPPPAFVTEKPF